MNDSNSAVEGITIQTTAATGVLSNDTDKDADALTVTSTGPFTGAFGTLFMVADGSYSYVGDNTAAINGFTTGTHAVDAFTYTESDGQGGSTSAVLSITIDRPPVAVNDSNVDVEGATVTTTAATGVFANDTDADHDALTVTTTGTFSGALGTLTLNADGSYSYVAGNIGVIDGAAAGSKPTDSFSFTESDGRGGTAVANLSITIDRNPVAQNDTNADLEGATITATAATGVLANDTDKDGDALTVTSIGTKVGTFGTLSLNADGSYSYVAGNAAAINGAAAGSHPVDVFTYTESDGHGGTASATLSITIDRPPVLGGIPASENYVVGQPSALKLATAATATDPDGDMLAGAVIVVNGGFTGDGDQLSVDVSGTSIGGVYDPGTETLTLTGKDTAVHYQQVLDSVAFSTGLNPTQGGAKPTRTVTWQTADAGGAASAISSETINFIVPTIAINTISGDNVINHAEAAANVTVSGTTTNVEDGQLVTVKFTNSSNAVVFTSTVPVSSNGWQVTLTPAQAQALADGNYTVSADVSDQIGVAATTAHRALLVDETSPTLVNDTNTVRGGKTITVTTAGQGVLSNDTDPNADPLTVTGVSDTSHGAGTIGAPLLGALGTLTLNANGSYSYNANHSPGTGRRPNSERRLHLCGDRSGGQFGFGHSDGDRRGP